MSAFRFNTKLDQAILLGRTADNLRELVAGIREAPGASIYYHTHHFLQQHHYLSPEPPNDFAYWITQVLNDDALGEILFSVDIVQFPSIAELRARIIEIIEDHLASGARVQDCPCGESFHFMASRTFVMRTPFEAHSLPEFLDALKNVSVGSLYYHIFDARLRLGHADNDFSRWFRDMGHTALADEVTKLDPYRYTLEGLRKKILTLGEKHAGH